jgi:hypothetical protein
MSAMPIDRIVIDTVCSECSYIVSFGLQMVTE